MLKKPWLPAAIAFLVSSTGLHADSLVEYKSDFGDKPFKIYISDIKQRTEMVLPMVGEQISITRADKNLQWDIYSKKKKYSEEPLAIPYQKVSEQETKKAEKDLQDALGDDEECTPISKKLPGTKVIGGLKSTGYEMTCRENPKEKMTVWIGEDTALSKKILREQEKCSKANIKAMYANFPAAERKEMEEAMGSIISGIVEGIPKMISNGDMPKGMWTYFSTSNQKTNKPTVLFELIRLSDAALPASMFEVPAGYKKMKEGESPVGMGDIFSDEMKKSMKDDAKEEAAEETMKSLFKGLGNLGN